MAIIKVLCAEDDRLMRLEMKEKMTAKGWEVIEAVDGKEALVKYKKYRPDIVVLDVNMPKRSGLEVLQLIRVNGLTDNITYDFAKAELCIGEQRQKLTMLESKVFAILCKNKNRLSPREVLLLAGWNSTAYNYESQLNKVIRKLRKLLMRENQVKIILDKGNGYWLKTEEDIHI